MYSSLPDADDQRAALAGDDERVGLILADDGDAIGALDLVQGHLHGALQQRDAGGDVILGFQFGVDVADEDGEHFGVGLAGEGVAFFGEELLEGDVVFDDAVVDQGDLAGVVDMGMGVAFGGSAVGGPAGVGHADVGWGAVVGVVEGVFEDADASDGPADVQLAGRVDDGDAGRVVAAIFQSLKPFDEKGLGDFFPT